VRKESLLFLVHDFFLRYRWLLINADVSTQITVAAGLVFALELGLSLSFELFQALVEHLFVALLLFC
jgi:hypothetical protein